MSEVEIRLRCLEEANQLTRRASGQTADDVVGVAEKFYRFVSPPPETSNEPA